MSKPNYRKNRGAGRSGADALTSGRWGFHKGRTTRTFHGNCGSTTKAQTTGRGGSVDYLDRSGAYANRSEDLIATGGRPADEMKAILDQVHAATKSSRGRIAVTWVQELPAELDQTAWRRIADALAADLEATGRPAHWAIHDDGQPHLHLVAAARPIRGDRVAAEGLRGRPAEAPSLWAQRDQVAAWRQQACGMVNAELKSAGIDCRWFAGRDSQMDQPGIVGRAPAKRVPEAAYRRGQRQRDPAAVEAARARHVAARAASTHKRLQAGQNLQKRLVRAAQEAGQALVPQVALRALEAAAARPPEVREVVKVVERPIQPPSPTASRVLDDWAAMGIIIPDELRQDGAAAGHAIRMAGELWKEGVKEARSEAALQAAEAARVRQGLERQNALLSAALERERQKTAQAMRKAKPAEPTFPSPSKPRGPSW